MRIFRQVKESLIIVNAHRVNNGQLPIDSYDKDHPQDFYFFEIEEPEIVLEKIIELCKEKIPKKFAHNPINDIQVVTPMHRGVVGAVNLNAELQKHLNPSNDEFIHGGRVLKIEDNVMQIRNNYDKEIYNGDIGRIVRIDRENQEVVVEYDRRAGTKKAIAIAIRNNKPQKRYTLLKDRLK